MLIKDEADVIEFTLRHLAAHVDEILVYENMSTDGTREILDRLAASEMPGLIVVDDEDPAYYQARKMTALAALALERGHQWVIPCDADEVWYVNNDPGRPIRSFLGGLGREVCFITAAMFNHFPSSEDPPGLCEACGGDSHPINPADVREFREYAGCPDHGGLGTGRCEVCGEQKFWRLAGSCFICKGDSEPNPLKRIGWRQREHGALPKVACKARSGLEIRQGNHSAWAPGRGLTIGGFIIRHFSWRSESQYALKLANGARAYAATDLDPAIGGHWRMFGHPDSNPNFDAAVRAHFFEWFYLEDPRSDDTMIYDPAPVSG